MITEVQVENFKSFRQKTFTLKPEGVTFLAGGNNSGKTTLLHAVAVWEFCRSIIEQEKGENALRHGVKGKGVGINSEDFSPIAVPDLRHLWHKLRPHGDGAAPSYNLKIRCSWRPPGAAPTDAPLHLEFGMLLSSERLYIKPSSSNLDADSFVPRIAYLPPFAGIAPAEERMSTAVRKRLIGRGIAGAVLRNTLYDLWHNSQQYYAKLRGMSGRVSQADLAEFRKVDSWVRLEEVLYEVFKVGLTVENFNELYHTRLRMTLHEMELVNKRFQRTKGSVPKDIMVEGSGFLQWLSVYTLAVSNDVNVLLLDEPDAHLHPTLQGHLTFKLNQVALQQNKQVLLATHSTTILSEAKPEVIFRMEKNGYLAEEEDRIALFEGIGSQYAPRLDQLKKHRRLFLYEGPSDLELLKIWCQKLGLAWPSNLVVWKYIKDRDARAILFDELRSDIDRPNNKLKGLSLQDRDDYPVAEVKQDLTFDNLQPFNKGLGLRRWRRRNIENYLLCPTAIARASGQAVATVDQFFSEHGLTIPHGRGFTDWNCINALLVEDGKNILKKHNNSVLLRFGVTYLQIATAMEPGEVPDDIRTLLGQLIVMCQT